MSTSRIPEGKKRLVVTLPDELVDALEVKGKELGLPKSALCAIALRNLVDGKISIQPQK